MRYILTLLIVLLFVRLDALHATDAPGMRPLLLASADYRHHDSRHSKRPFLHWTYPSSETNALAKKAHVELTKTLPIDAFLVDWGKRTTNSIKNHC